MTSAIATPADNAASPPASHHRRCVRRRWVTTAIASCVALTRAILVLREYHELDYAEIASVLELELGTVKSRLSRARGALRAHLVAALPELGDRHGR